MQDNAARGDVEAAAPGVSVIIPVRNAATTLSETLRSLAAQSHHDHEIIIIDDGSTDETVAVIESWMAQDARIRLLRQSPSGVSAARNHGLAEAKKDWILFLDGDDWISPDFFARMLDAARDRPEADVVYCGYQRIMEDGTLLDDVFIPEIEANPLKVFSTTCAVAIHSLLIRRALLQESGGFDTSLKTAEDWDLWIRFARMGALFVGVNAVMALYRIREGSASSKAMTMAKSYKTVVQRAHSPDPRVRRGPRRYRHGWPGRSLEDLNRLCVYNAAYLAMLEAATGGPGSRAIEAIETQVDCTSFLPLMAKTMFHGLTRETGIQPAALRDDIGIEIARIVARIAAMCSATDAADRLMAEVMRRIFEHQDLGTPRTLWGVHACELDLAAPTFAVEVPQGVHHLLLRLRYKSSTIEEFYLPADSIVSHKALEARFLEATGFVPPASRYRRVRTLKLVWRYATMIAGSAWRIWRTKWDRKGKFVALAQNLRRIFDICARHTTPAPSRLADRDGAAQLVRECRAAVLGSSAVNQTAEVVPFRREAPRTGSVPVLMYHRVAEDGPAALREWRVEPRHFEEQLAFLKREGFTTITSRELGAAMRGERALPRRPVMLTFDDAYVDFYTDAFPLLKKHGATAELFVVSGKVGGAADWDSAYGPPAPLMGWTQLAELDRAGIVIGSHLVSHAKATSLDDETLIREGAVSRFMLEARLGHPVTSLALPFGDHDDRVIDAMMLCGYREVYTCEPVVAALSGDPLRIPRLNIGGDIDLPSFARMLDVASAKRAALA